MTIELSLIRIKTCTSLLGFIVYLPRIKEYAVLLLIFFRLVLLLFQKSDIWSALYIFARSPIFSTFSVAEMINLQNELGIT